MYTMKVRDALNIESRENTYTIYTKKSNGLGYNWNDYKRNKVPTKLLNAQCYAERLGGWVSIRIVK